MSDIYEFAIGEFVEAFHNKGKKVFKETFYDSDPNFWKHVLRAMGKTEEGFDTFQDFSFNTLYGIMQDKLKKDKSCLGPGRPRPIYKLWMSSKGEPNLLLKLGKYYKDDKIKLCTILQKLWDLKYEDGLIGATLFKKCKKFIKSYARINLVGSLLRCLMNFCDLSDAPEVQDVANAPASVNEPANEPANETPTEPIHESATETLELPNHEVAIELTV